MAGKFFIIFSNSVFFSFNQKKFKSFVEKKKERN